jgi:thioredoxin reductase
LHTWDLVVMGGGPAGASAALVAGGNGLETCLLEAGPRLGGQLHWADAPILDLLGLPRVSGPDLAASFRAQLEAAGVEVQTSAPVVALDQSEAGLIVELDSGARLDARRVLLATGLRRRTLGIPGEALAEHVRSPRREASAYAGAKVIVVGGGDEAADTARGLAAAGGEVSLLVRTRLRARPLFADPLRAQPGVTILEDVRVLRFSPGAEAGIVAELEDGRRLEAAGCFVRVGAEAAVPRIAFPIERLPDGRLRTGPVGRTSHPRLYVAGDLVHLQGERYVSSAMGSGAIAARAIETSLKTVAARSVDETDRRG